jgi:hypothetical protein
MSLKEVGLLHDVEGTFQRTSLKKGWLTYYIKRALLNICIIYNKRTEILAVLYNSFVDVASTVICG